MSNLLLNCIGWKAALLHDDPCAYDRWVWLSKHLEKGSLKTLDAGCGTGAFSCYAATCHNNVVGLSFDEASNNYATAMAQKLQLSNAKFLTIDLRNLADHSELFDQFDQVICFETIEHILDDQSLVLNLSRLLKPGGKLFLTTPYKHYKHLIGDKLSEVEDGGHVRWGYTHQEMETIFNKANLNVVYKDYVSGVFSQQITNLLRLLGNVNKRFAWTVTLPLRLLRPLDKFVTRLIKYPSLSIAVIGEKQKNK